VFSPHGSFSAVQLLPLIVILPLIALWIWMFRDMLDNVDLPPSAKENWTLAFILLNVIAAVLYYVNVYQDRTRR